MKLNEAVDRIACGKCSINDFKYDKELLLSLLDYDIYLYNSLSNSLKKNNEILDSILSMDSIPFGIKFGVDKSLDFIDDEKLYDKYISIKLRSNYYRLFCLICNILPDLNYNLKNISDSFIKRFEQFISCFSINDNQFNVFKMFFGLYNGNIMSHDELCSLLQIDVFEIEITIQEVYNHLCDDSRLKFELITLAREECKICVSEDEYKLSGLNNIKGKRI